jgi:thiol-disulfide isomerase/thioredoxin
MKTIKIFLPLLLLLISVSVFAQEGIRFNNGSFADLKAKAAAEKKLIFIDCYTSWCAPCKWMDQNVFPLPEVAEKYNNTFINARFDMEKGEGPELRKQYNVSSFPTYLFIDATGKLVYRSGSRMTAAEFLTVGENAANPAKSLAAMREKYNGGNREMQFMLDYFDVLQDNDRSAASRLGEEINATFPEKYLATPLGWTAIQKTAYSADDRLGAWFMAHQGYFGSIASKGAIDSLANRMVAYQLYGYVRNNNDSAFLRRVKYFTGSKMLNRQKEGVMQEAEFLLARQRYADFNKLANKALKGLLKEDADKLSFLARRAAYQGKGEPAVEQVAYEMAKRAVVLQPEEYSTQSTLAQLCLSVKKKEEGLAAAKIAYGLAGTTKIEGLVNKLIAQLEAL